MAIENWNESRNIYALRGARSIVLKVIFLVNSVDTGCLNTKCCFYFDYYDDTISNQRL